MTEVARSDDDGRRRARLVLALLALFGSGLFLLSFLIGHYPLTNGQVVRILSSRIIGAGGDWSQTTETVVLGVRLPRILAAVLTGAALAAAGATYQTMFRNPLASPAVLGVSAGAGFGASLALLLQSPSSLVQASAFLFGLIAVSITLLCSGRFAGSSPVTLVLAGMVVAAIFQALIAGLKYVADPTDALPTITFWLLGSLARVTMDQVAVATAPVVVGFGLLWIRRWRINIAALPEEEARALGIDARSLRLVAIVASTLATAAAVSLAGIVGWVGLLVPHMARMVVGSDFRDLLPVSAAMGGVFLLLIDDLCRGATATEVPLGIVTALIGAPIFLYLLAKARGGWF